MTILPPTYGLVLAGGLARRMGGGDKAKIEINGANILDRVLATLSGQCAGIVINANGDPARFADAGVPIIADNVPDHPGPLAGILAGLDWLSAQDNGIEWMLSVPADCPFLPDDLVERLHRGRQALGAGVPFACARSGEWRHPVIALWPIAVREELRRALTVEDLRKIEVFTARRGVAVVDWPGRPIDPFFNVNTPDDVKRAEELAKGFL